MLLLLVKRESTEDCSDTALKVLTFAVLSASISVAYDFVHNSFVSRHVTYDIEEEKEQNNAYGQDCE